jgi:hypothetical protein
MVLLTIASVVNFLVGGWFLFTSLFFFGSSKAIAASEKHAGVEMADNATLRDIDFIYYTLTIIGILAILLSIVMLWLACEIFVLVKKSHKEGCAGNYKTQIDDEWSAAAKWQRGITQ